MWNLVSLFPSTLTSHTLLLSSLDTLCHHCRPLCVQSHSRWMKQLPISSRQYSPSLPAHHNTQPCPHLKHKTYVTPPTHMYLTTMCTLLANCLPLVAHPVHCPFPYHLSAYTYLYQPPCVQMFSVSYVSLSPCALPHHTSSQVFCHEIVDAMPDKLQLSRVELEQYLKVLVDQQVRTPGNFLSVIWPNVFCSRCAFYRSQMRVEVEHTVSVSSACAVLPHRYTHAYIHIHTPKL